MKRLVKGLSVREHGDRGGIPIVLIHGFPFSSRMWDQQVAVLSKSYFCVAYDVRGLGESPAGDGQFTVEMFVDDLFAVIAALKLDRPVVAGFSMGGYIALRAVEREPAGFRGLILCNTKSEIDNNAAKLRRAYGIKLINQEGMRNFALSVVPTCFAEDAPSRIAEAYRAALDEAAGQDPVGVKGCLLAMAARTDTTAALIDIHIPTLLIAGEKDALSPPAVMQSMHEKIDGSRFAIIPRAGHMSPVENPSAVNQQLLSFLQENFATG